MKVFLSWSGARSKALAELLYTWLPQVIQAIEPWMSSEMEKGRKWSPEISNWLSETRFGLLCLTRENLSAPWLLFEAGALSKTPDAYVWTFLHGISPADVEQPLAQFQHTLSEKSDVRKLMHTINQAVRNQNEKSLADTALDKTFETFWPELDAGLAALAYTESQGAARVRGDRDILEELLELARSQQQRQDASTGLSRGEISWIKTAPTESLRTIHHIWIELDVPEENAKRFLDELQISFASADMKVAVAPGTDRVTRITMRLLSPLITTMGVLWPKLARASEAAGLTILDWGVGS